MQRWDAKRQPRRKHTVLDFGGLRAGARVGDSLVDSVEEEVGGEPPATGDGHPTRDQSSALAGELALPCLGKRPRGGYRDNGEGELRLVALK